MSKDKKMTETQKRALDSIKTTPRYPAGRFFRTFRALVRLGYAETIFGRRTVHEGRVLDSRCVGFTITEAGRSALN